MHKPCIYTDEQFIIRSQLIIRTFINVHCLSTMTNSICVSFPINDLSAPEFSGMVFPAEILAVSAHNSSTLVAQRYRELTASTSFA